MWLSITFLLLGAIAFGGWKEHPSPQDEFHASEFVFVGEVLASKDVSGPDGFVCGTFYTLRPSETLKGRTEEKVELYSENSSGRFPMDVGKSYLVFVSAQTFEGIAGTPLAINAAGNSNLVESAGKALTIARKLRKETPNLPYSTARPGTGVATAHHSRA